jgi:ABC-type Fe3+-hydroxamate transport system substrate-binding protein
MSQYTDQLGNTIILKQTPGRIISLVPSQTELLYDLGLNEEVIGITKFCIHPEKWFRIKTRIGGTKTLNIEKIKELQPDLIIANKEENVKEQVEILRSVAPVWTSDINDLDDALQMIRSIGEIVVKPGEAENISGKIISAFSQLDITAPQLRTVYLVWKDPYMTVGGNTFINDMLERCGFENVFADKERYPTISLEELAANNCQLVLLSSEPYPFKEKNIAEIQKIIPGAKILLADGEMFSWYGSRLQYAPDYFRQLLADL